MGKPAIIDQKTHSDGSKLTIIEPKSRKEIKQFKKLPFKIYEGNEYWVPHLSVEINDFIDLKNNQQFKDGEGKLFLVYKDEEPVARIIGGINNKVIRAFNQKRALFTLIEFIEDYEVFKFMMDTVVKYAKDKGMEILWGPQSPDFGDDYQGLLIDAYDVHPYFTQPYHHPYYREFLEKYGFEDYQTLITMDLDVTRDPSDKAKRMVDLIMKRYNIEIREANTKDFNNEVRILANIYADAFDEKFLQEYPGFVPPSYEDFLQLAKGLKMFMVPEILLYAYVKGEPAGIIFCFPDFNEVIKKTKGRLLPFGWLRIILNKRKVKRARVFGLAVKKKFHGMGLSHILSYKAIMNGKDIGYIRAESGTMHHDNYKILNAVKEFDGKEYKHYRHYGMKI